MGTFKWPLRIASMDGQQARDIEATVDTGASFTTLPASLLVSDHTYYVWGKEYGSMGVEQVRRLKELEKENVRLKRLVADLSLDKDILKEALKGNS